MLDIINTPDSQTYQLVGTIAATGATPTIKITGDDPTLDIGATLPSELILHITPEIDIDGKSKSESFYVNTPVDNGDGTYSYTTVYRALKNNVSNNPPQASDSIGSGGYKLHTDGAAVIISPTTELRHLKNTFTAGTTTATAEAGEALTIRNSVSLHTDGKIYKYHSTNYPNVIGIVNAGYSAGATATYTTFNGVSTGHSALTIGQNVYAENTGTITQSASATAKKFGVATSTTTIRLALVTDNVTTFKDSTFSIYDEADATKDMVVTLGGATTGKTLTLKSSHTDDRTIEFPNLNGTLVLDTSASFNDSAFSLKNISDVAADPTTALTAALSGVAGNINNGTHIYKITFITDTGETLPGTVSNTITVTDNTVNGQVSLTNIPVSAQSSVRSRKIYRQFNGAGDYKLLTTIANNTATTFTDNVANATLTTVAPTSNTTLKKVSVNTNGITSDRTISTPDASGTIILEETNPIYVGQTLVSAAVTANDTLTTVYSYTVPQYGAIGFVAKGTLKCSTNNGGNFTAFSFAYVYVDGVLRQTFDSGAVTLISFLGAAIALKGGQLLELKLLVATGYGNGSGSFTNSERYNSIKFSY